ncbi:hypothetical protein A0H81_13435 [Grifola frondosa]|uniref:Uncharacterized protein n=1 Tax=Grifola frondosa TaxID=5627 RepID=A0A1C7LR49_GRIFR|nr:hypothetical protein A0H81_13435 [Grifola frondosa]
MRKAPVDINATVRQIHHLPTGLDSALISPDLKEGKWPTGHQSDYKFNKNTKGDSGPKPSGGSTVSYGFACCDARYASSGRYKGKRKEAQGFTTPRWSNVSEFEERLEALLGPEASIEAWEASEERTENEE